MSNSTDTDSAATAGEAGGGAGSQDGVRGPRMLPAAVIVAAHLLALWLSTLASTTIMNVMGLGAAPLLAGLLLIIWWLTSKGVSGKERIAGLLLFAAALLWIFFSQKSNGVFILMVALPTLTTGIVGLLLLTAGLRWPVRRWILVVFVVGCAGGFTGVRVDDVGGNMRPILSWRWSPTPDERFAAAAPPRSESSGTAALPSEAGPDDWPGFRGAGRDGRVVGAAKFSTNWESAAPREVWRRPVGLGWSSFAVVGDYVFTQEQRGQDEVVVCYGAATGEEVWVNRAVTRFVDAMGDGPRATPTFHLGRLYAQGATGLLQCLDASTGETVWKRDLKADTGAGVPTWGFASSPLIAGELAVVFSGADKGKSVVAYDLASGDLVWSAGDGSSGYSSGHLVRIAEVPQILMSSDFGLQSFAPDTGKVLWGHAWENAQNPRTVQPRMVNADSVVVGTGSGKGTRLLRIEKTGASWTVEAQWTTKRFKPYFNDFVYHEGHCYGFDGSRLICIDAETGERRWKGPRYGGQVLLLAEMEMLLVLSEKGDVILIPATPEGHSEAGRFKALSAKTWNHPAVAQGKLFVRNSEEAVCYELTPAG